MLLSDADAVGLRGGTDAVVVPAVVSSDSQPAVMECGICLEPRPAGDMASPGCAHYYCRGCWSSYISAAVAAGPGCLGLRCPDESCSRAVLPEMVDRLATTDDKQRYDRFLMRSFVDDDGSRRRKWCPAPGCTYAIELVGDNDGNDDVLCRCGHGFCFRCGEEPHWPLDCGSTSRWAAERRSEEDKASEDWIIVNTKACPRCKRPIEKSDLAGCSHMECPAPCLHKFCWFCLGGDLDDDALRCDCAVRRRVFLYDLTAAEEEDLLRRSRAREELSQFLRRRDQWASILQDLRHAERELRRLRYTARLADELDVPATELRFLADAWAQVAEGRRVVANMFIHRRRLQERDGHGMLEHRLEQAMSMLERLQSHATAAEGGDDPVAAGRELAELTSVTAKSMAKALEPEPAVAGAVTSGGAVEVKQELTN